MVKLRVPIIEDSTAMETLYFLLKGKNYAQEMSSEGDKDPATYSRKIRQLKQEGILSLSVGNEKNKKIAQVNYKELLKLIYFIKTDESILSFEKDGFNLSKISEEWAKFITSSGKDIHSLIKSDLKEKEYQEKFEKLFSPILSSTVSSLAEYIKRVNLSDEFHNKNKLELGKTIQLENSNVIKINNDFIQLSKSIEQNEDLKKLIKGLLIFFYDAFKDKKLTFKDLIERISKAMSKEDISSLSKNYSNEEINLFLNLLSYDYKTLSQLYDAYLVSTYLRPLK